MVLHVLESNQVTEGVKYEKAVKTCKNMVCKMPGFERSHLDKAFCRGGKGSCGLSSGVFNRRPVTETDFQQSDEKTASKKNKGQRKVERGRKGKDRKGREERGKSSMTAFQGVEMAEL